MKFPARNRLQRSVIALLGAVSFIPPGTALLSSSSAEAHGAAQWIADGGYRTPNGSMCCGVSDCHRAEGAVATRVTNGYQLAVSIEGRNYALFVPQAAVYDSIDN